MFPLTISSCTILTSCCLSCSYSLWDQTVLCFSRVTQHCVTNIWLTVYMRRICYIGKHVQSVAVLLACDFSLGVSSSVTFSALLWGFAHKCRPEQYSCWVHKHLTSWLASVFVHSQHTLGGEFPIKCFKMCACTWKVIPRIKLLFLKVPTGLRLYSASKFIESTEPQSWQGP